MFEGINLAELLMETAPIVIVMLWLFWRMERRIDQLLYYLMTGEAPQALKDRVKQLWRQQDR